MGSRRYFNVSKSRVVGSVTDKLFASYDYIVYDDLFREHKWFLNIPMFSPFYWRSKELVNQFVNSGMLPGRAPIRALVFR